MRQARRHSLSMRSGFNPRICKRCDNKVCVYRFRQSVSIHASVKDATSRLRAFRIRALVSIHASVKDATWKAAIGIELGKCFNPRICKRCDKHWMVQPEARYWRFNPRICKRCDKKAQNASRRNWWVSIHASVKDATVLPG